MLATQRGSRPAAAAAAGSSMMGSRLALFGALALLLAVSFGAAEAAPAVVVGSVKCLDCSLDDVSAEDALKGLQVAIKCRSGAGETYETQTVGRLDDNGAFSIPLQAGLLREDGRLDRDCFAQLHSAPGTPCDGPAPPRIAPAKPSTQGVADANTYLAVAEDTVFSPVACACKKKKKNFMVGPPPPPPPRPEPSYGPPTPTPTPTPTPSYGPPSTPKPPAPEDDPKPFFHKHPKMKKMMHKKKPCPPLGEEDKPERKN
ncbi:proline-rich protein 4-like [Hordeum vulgare]|nr:proline-rich protein 4-like [Hordeum vulgare]